MSEPILTAGGMRAAEAHAIAIGATVEGLMARAGAAVADEVAARWPGREVLVACGPGNNGGDGVVAARRLAERGVTVRVAALAPSATDAAKTARAGWPGPVEPLGAETGDAAVMVDAVFGTGLKRALDPALAGALARLGREARVAVDLPSGVSTDDGRLLGEVGAFDLTVALGALKPAHRLRPAAERCGETVVADLGLSGADLAAGSPTLVSIVRPRLAAPDHDANKYTRGKVVVLGGAMAGAATLAAMAAQRSGAGYVALVADVVPGPPWSLVRQPWSADALDDRRIGAVVCGPGLGHDDRARAMLAAALASPHPLVLDADALTLIGSGGLGRLADRQASTLLTPHEGEFARLVHDVGEDRIAAVRRAAAQSGAIVLLKGAATIIARPDGAAAIARLAPPWLASAGTGDVLSGIAGTMLAQIDDPFEAMQAAVWLHGEAARRAGPGLIADDLVAALQGALAACL